MTYQPSHYPSIHHPLHPNFTIIDCHDHNCQDYTKSNQKALHKYSPNDFSSSYQYPTKKPSLYPIAK